MRNRLLAIALISAVLSCNPKIPVDISPTATTGNGLTQEDFHTTRSLSIKEGEGIYLNISADCLVLFPDWKKDIDQLSREQVITLAQDYVGTYANTQVSALLINVNYQRACYDSKVMEPYWDVKDPDRNVTDWPLQHWKIHKKGIDLCGLYVNTCRQKNISPWLSIRMNDHHYFSDSSKINRFWLKNPQYRLSTGSMFNYARSEVRAYYKSFIEEALSRYDVDGIELDWMRTHTNFRKGEEGLGIDLLTEFMQQIRVLVNQKAKERGHPIRVAVRVPSSPSISKSFGLDGVSWVQNGYVDILTPTNWYTPTNFDIPLEQWRETIGNNTAKTYMLVAGADGAHLLAAHKNLKQMQSNIESMRGFSATAYSRGADAVYFFNNSAPVLLKKNINKDGTSYLSNDRPLIFNEAGKYSTLVGKARSHVYTYIDPDIKPRPEEGYSLSRGAERLFTIHTGPKPVSGKYIVRVGLESLSGYANADLSVKVNDKLGEGIEDMPRASNYIYDNSKVYDYVYNVAETSARVMQYRVDLSDVLDGYNRIKITNNKEEVQKIVWLEIFIE